MLTLVAAAATCLLGQDRPGRAERLRSIDRQIERLQRELDELAEQERGVLGELERLDAELRLREAESRRVSLRLEEVQAAIESRRSVLAGLEAAQTDRRRYLAFRLREIYKAGRGQGLRRFVGGDRVDRYLSALRYASHLSERDGRVLRAYREDARRVAAEQGQLERERGRLQGLRVEVKGARRRIASTRRRREELLTRVRDDQSTRLAAMDELQAAAQGLGHLVDTLGEEADGVDVDVRKFRGLLDWPSSGEVSAGFGTVVHPRFRTRVPHPGLDIEGPVGGDIRAVFEGRVVFASWMRGYGLTTIVDHGSGVLSIYSHASVLLVEPGEEVLRGALLGQVGDTGSLRGPYLYFELRVGGQPVDPGSWLRPGSDD